MTLHAFPNHDPETRCKCGEITVAEALENKPEDWFIVDRDTCEAPFHVRYAYMEEWMKQFNDSSKSSIGGPI